MARSPIAIYAPFHPDEADYPFYDIVARGNGLIVTCWGEGCEHSSVIGGEALLKFGASRTIRELSGRMKCPACGSKRVAVHVVGVNMRPGQMRPD